MALIPLQPPKWTYDDQRRQLIIEFEEAPPPDIADPALWEPSFTYTVELSLPKAATKNPKPTHPHER